MINNSHAFLFTNINQEKLEIEAKKLIKLFLCKGDAKDNCNQCQGIDQEMHINLLIIDGFNGKIKSEDVILVKKYSSMTSINNQNTIIYIKGIEYITPKAANTLLKFLEEPFSNIKFIFTTQNKHAVLETIVSRTLEKNLQGSNIYQKENNQKIDDWSLINLSNIELKNYINNLIHYEKSKLSIMVIKKLLGLIRKLDSNVNKNLIVNALIRYKQEELNKKN